MLHLMIFFDNAVSITGFDLSLKSYFQTMKYDNLDHNLNDHEFNKTKMNKLFVTQITNIRYLD